MDDFYFFYFIWSLHNIWWWFELKEETLPLSCIKSYIFVIVDNALCKIEQYKTSASYNGGRYEMGCGREK